MLRIFLILITLLVISPQFKAADFKTALEITLKKEGGYAKGSKSHGEYYCGISRRHHPKWEGWKIVDSIKADLGIKNRKKCSKKIIYALDRKLAETDTVKGLTEKFYKEEFWDRLDLDDEDDQDRANMIFDKAVRRGVKAYIMSCQDVTE
jgi:lysozyme family protein